MFYQLPPVGNPISLHAKSDNTSLSVLTSEATRYYASGTAALAAAISASILKRNSLGQCSGMPEVILPAYACPDLLSAVLFCGAKPVLVDICEARPWLDLTQLAAAITENTVAVVAVNLFGLSERWQQIRKVIADKDIVLIEDSAQYFPGSDEAIDWQGDLVVFSFGRGKPVSLLGGGAVLCRKMDLYPSLPEPQSSRPTQSFTYSLKAWLYNAMISPHLYWLPRSLPFLKLGETQYHSLQAIDPMDRIRLGYLEQNITTYQNDDMALSRTKNIVTALDSMDNVVNLPQVCKMQANRRLLRYPVLLEDKVRDLCFRELVKAGLGASILYPASLPEIAGVGDVFNTSSVFPKAQAFATRLLTLPTHSKVSDGDIEKMKSILTKFT